MSNDKSKKPDPKPAAAGAKAAPVKPVAAAPAKPAVEIPPAAASKAPPQPKVPPLFRWIDWVAFALATLCALVGYLYTMAPEVTLQDSGELATGSFYAGIPHPPGYPIWTMLTHLFTYLPFSNIAVRVSLLSALSAALSCGFVALMVSRSGSMFIEGIAELRALDRRWENLFCLVSGFVAGTLIGFHGFMWSQASIVEVYNFSLLSLMLVMVCLLRWIYAPHQHRYLYLVFFWFGICFNNHQSLLVIAMGLEVAVLMAQPKLGRDLFFWNVVIWLAATAMKAVENPALFFIFQLIGIGSLITWITYLVLTKKPWLELARDFALVASLGYLALLVGTITSHVTVFYYQNTLMLKGSRFIPFNFLGVLCIGIFIALSYLVRKGGKEWLMSLGCGGSWVLGSLFYLYMPLAGMSNPPMQWGYPRTVQGFFHAFTRGQYERVNPTGTLMRYLEQIWLFISMCLEEFSIVYVLLGIIPFFLVWRMQKRERAWLIGNGALFICLSFLLLYLLNPGPDRQARDLNKVFFTAGMLMVAISIGYGIALLLALVATNYQRIRIWFLGGLGVASVAAIGMYLYQTLVETPPPSPLQQKAAVGLILLTLGLTGLLALARNRAPIKALLVAFALMPAWSIFSHWADNEQRGHLFGYWFGHDMFTPPFTAPDGSLSYDAKLRAEQAKKPDGKLVYPEMARDAVIYGGTDPGRFNPTYMIFCESFIPPEDKPYDPAFDRRDCYLITQNALADGTYLNYIRAHYNRSAQYPLDENEPFFQQLLRGNREIVLNQVHEVEYTNLLARAVDPLDHFFLNLGDDIEKNRRAGSSFFRETDFVDLNGFAERLRSGPKQSKIGRYLLEQLSPETQALLAGKADEPAVRRALARELNLWLDRELATNKVLAPKLAQREALAKEIKELAGPTNQVALAQKQAEQEALNKEIADLNKVAPFYTPERFSDVPLTDHLASFLRENPQYHSRIRMNRLLLEAAFPRELAKSVGGVYPDLEIPTASPKDSERAFNEYLEDAQKRLKENRLRPGEDVRFTPDGKVQVSGQVAVMAINALITKIMFDKTPDHEFYVEESFPLDWMYPHLVPFGIIMRINRDRIVSLDDDTVKRDHEFWSKYSERLVGNWITYDTPVSNICHFAERAYLLRQYAAEKSNPMFIRDNDAQKAFSKLRSAIGGVYSWRYKDSITQLGQIQGLPPAQRQLRLPEIQRLENDRVRMMKEADFAFRQAFAYCPYSPEAVFRYMEILLQNNRVDDALMILRTAHKMDPGSPQLVEWIRNLERQVQSQPASVDPAQVEAMVATDPNYLMVAQQLAGMYLQQQQAPKAMALVEKMKQNPKAGAEVFRFAAQIASMAGQLAAAEKDWVKYCALTPANPDGCLELSLVQAAQNQRTQAMASLHECFRRNALRLAANPAAPDHYRDVQTNAKYDPFRPMPEFQKIMAEFQPK